MIEPAFGELDVRDRSSSPDLPELGSSATQEVVPDEIHNVVDPLACARIEVWDRGGKFETLASAVECVVVY